ncbi:hypothetical protein UVI_02006570 [Ustilaginoidea virens]|uniref:STB6-like N-terminal domain-containing protein n=1 Tax=Ustilaginoidea virens TaxID=1159556 RepID=A0A1B5KW63_USTVR|nr:hypothetical protein UVI_02006570 [Ustilaginoidea virens]
METSGSLDQPTNSPVPQRRLALPDPLAFRFLEEDACTNVVERRRVLGGYELYLVEQWTCSRQSPIITVATFTGDERHSIVVGIMSIPKDQALWSARLRLYFKISSQHNARPKETELGELMITNLSSFPSALTVIAVPQGDVRRYRHMFIVNEDLKRLGCSGRSGLALTDPTEATQAKFHQLYKTSDHIPIAQSVTELVKLCQIALYMFEKLDYQYIDGLICDVTERAIGNWWTELGAEHYNFEPTDGILGPSTVSALLGMLMGARNRLHWFGAPVSKDVFDVEATKRGIAYFQKQQKLEKSRRLDRQTVFRLHTATAKGAAGEGWGVQRAVKSTVTEIGGKKGEIVMDMVSGKGKGGLADVETLDIDVLVNLAYGDRPRWLWHAKARRCANDSFGTGDQDVGSALLVKGDPGNPTPKRVSSHPLDEEQEMRRKEEGWTGLRSGFPSGSVNTAADPPPGERDALRKGVFKSVTDKMSDARSGLGRIKDVVGGNRRGHLSKLSISTKEEVSDGGNAGAPSAPSAQSSAMVPSAPVVGRAFTWKNKPGEYLAAIRDDEDALPGRGGEAKHVAASVSDSRVDDKSGDELLPATELEHGASCVSSGVHKDSSPKASSAGPSLPNDGDLPGQEPRRERKTSSDAATVTMARRHSLDTADATIKQAANEMRWPRRMSFGDAEEAILTWEEVVDVTDSAEYAACMEAHAGAASHLHHLMEEVVSNVGPWTEEKIRAVEFLDERYARDRAELQGLYQQLSEACQRVRYSSDELLSEQRDSLTESVKEIEVLVARVEYEINGLAQKVHDVEDSIQAFERQVDHVEGRAAELKVALESESWLHWLVRTLTGVGTGPNITRGL